MTTTLDLNADIIEVCDIIERVEELAEELPTHTATALECSALVNEHATLCVILRELAGNGGDEQWRGDWYPSTLIRDSHFTEYARELVVDCDDIPSNLPHYIVINWDATAHNVRTDYTSTDIDGVTYWYR
jgi:hypothetical protein